MTSPGFGVYAIAAVAPFWVMRLIGFFGGAIQPGHTGGGVRGAAVGATVADATTATRGATSSAAARAFPALIDQFTSRGGSDGAYAGMPITPIRRERCTENAHHFANGNGDGIVSTTYAIGEYARAHGERVAAGKPRQVEPFNGLILC